MYSNNDFRYYKGGSYLAHYGTKGMKWKKKKSQWDPKNRPVARKKTPYYSNGKDPAAGRNDFVKDGKVSRRKGEKGRYFMNPYGKTSEYDYSVHNVGETSQNKRTKKLKKKKSWREKIFGR